jgi:hypothetical protein
MKKTVQIITVPLSKEGWSKGDIINDGKFTSIGIYSSEGFGNWQTLQLLVLSDDEIQAGDWYTWKDGTIHKSTRNNKPRPDCNGYRVVASYPQIEGTLPISKETVHAWIDSGTPGEGSVEMVGRCPLQTCDNPDCSVECQEVEMVCKLWKGNLLLEFLMSAYDGVDFEPIKPRNSKLIHKSIDKPSIPTDEEIREKGLSALKKEREVDDGEQLSAFEGRCLTTGFYQGYKQALKDLGHE